jgi:hypothetical protein
VLKKLTISEVLTFSDTLPPPLPPVLLALDMQQNISFKRKPFLKNFSCALPNTVFCSCLVLDSFQLLIQAKAKWHLFDVKNLF